MDFGKLLHTAQKNEQSVSKTGVRYYSTKFEPPKKQKRNNHELSANIKKFLARKEAEEKKKQEEEQRKREELLALRSQDRKATRRVNVMLKRTKSANQSVIDDAFDKDNTAVTLAGPLQPDEDDYGYVSQEASAFYNKMMEKYSKMPDEPKFDMHRKKVSTNLGSTKDRVKAALEKEKEDALLPHKRKRKHGDKKDEADEDGVNYGAPERGPGDSKVNKEEKALKPKPKPAAPVLNFAELLKIAEKKQHEPIVIEKKEKDDTVLMTKKQKKEFEREKESRQRREEKWRDYDTKGSQSVKSPKSNGSKVDQPSKPSSLENRNKISKTSKDDAKNFKIPAAKSNENKSTKVPQESPPKKYLPGDVRAKNGEERRYLPGDTRYKPSAIAEEKNTKKYVPGDIRGNTIPKKPPPIDNKLKNPLNSEQPQKKFLPGDIRAKATDQAQRKYPPTKNGSSESDRPVNSIDSQRKPSALNSIKSKMPAENSKLGRAPIRDMKPKQFPPPDVRRREGNFKKPSIPNKRRILDDDDDEYDSEMDDFIDDGDGEGDYSKYISEIFGYDKSKYRDTEDDIDNMESTFAQQMREEVISTKIGIMEDLEDMKQEEEAKRKKLMIKKRKL